MKKILAVLLVALMVCSFAACSTDSDSGTSINDLFGTTPVENSDKDSVTDTADGIGSLNTPVTGDTVVLTPDSKDVYIVNNEEYSFLIEDIEACEDSYYVATIDIRVENKAKDEDTDYIFSTENASVDGLTGYIPYFESLEGGDDSSEEINVSHNPFPDGVTYGPKDATIIQFDCVVQDGNFQDVCRIPVVIYPKGESRVSLYERTQLSTDEVIYNENDIKVTYVGMDNSYGLGEAFFYIENQASSSVCVTYEDMKINGKTADCYFSANVLPDNKIYSYIFISDSQFEEIGIKELSQVKELSFKLIVTDYETYEEIANENITVKVK